MSRLVSSSRVLLSFTKTEKKIDHHITNNKANALIYVKILKLPLTNRQLNFLPKMMMSLHGRKFRGELDGDLRQVAEDFYGTRPHIGLVVVYLILLTEGCDEFVSLFQVVTGHHGEEVVVHLVLQTAAEPVHEPVGRDVASRCYLQFPEIRSLRSCRYSNHPPYD